MKDCRETKPLSRKSASKLALIAIVLTIAAGCGPRKISPVQRGEAVYRTNCVSCHNINPNLPGPIGPPIAGSPLALIKARVLHQSYPPGYKPKRKTHLMRKMPWLAPRIPDLAAFLDAAADHRKQ